LLYKVCSGGGLYLRVAKTLLAGWVWGGNIDRLVIVDSKSFILVF
jgi:hypothetical protein